MCLQVFFNHCFDEISNVKVLSFFSYVAVSIFQELIPFINWVRSTFSIPVLGLLLFASVALFPSILLPSSPSMWMAGLTFGYGKGFLLILSAASIGVTLPFLIGHLFLHKMQVSIIIPNYFGIWFPYSLGFLLAGMVEAVPEKSSHTSSCW